VQCVAGRRSAGAGADGPIGSSREVVRWRAGGASSPAGSQRRSRRTGQRGAWGRCGRRPAAVRAGRPPPRAGQPAPGSRAVACRHCGTRRRYACRRRCRLRVTAGLIPRRPGVPLRLGGAARHLFIMGARRPQTPAWSLRSRATRKEGRRARASATKPTRLALPARGAHFGVWPPAHPAPSPSSPSAANPARLPCAAGGASAPAAPQGAPAKQQPQPGQAKCKYSGGAGFFCQGYPRCARR